MVKLANLYLSRQIQNIFLFTNESWEQVKLLKDVEVGIKRNIKLEFHSCLHTEIFFTDFQFHQLFIFLFTSCLIKVSQETMIFFGQQGRGVLTYLLYDQFSEKSKNKNTRTTSVTICLSQKTNIYILVYEKVLLFGKYDTMCPPLTLITTKAP